MARRMDDGAELVGDLIIEQPADWPIPGYWFVVRCDHGQTVGVQDTLSDRRGMVRHLVERHRREFRCGCSGAGRPLNVCSPRRILN